MGTHIYRNYPVFFKVKGDITETEKICTRCDNKVAYELVYIADGVGFPGIWTLKYNKHYFYKCPICPNYDPVDKEVAKALITTKSK